MKREKFHFSERKKIFHHLNSENLKHFLKSLQRNILVWERKQGVLVQDTLGLKLYGSLYSSLVCSNELSKTKKL